MIDKCERCGQPIAIGHTCHGRMPLEYRGRCDIAAGGTICGATLFTIEREHTCIQGVGGHEFHGCSCGREWVDID